jgi:predicted GNAT superfamily acetyltransferase
VTAIEFRDLKTTEDLSRVVEIEKRIWGYTTGDDVVPLPILAVTAHRGAVLVGAFAGDEMVGFVYSIPAIHAGRLSHWSHMMGVVTPYRGSGLGHQLKAIQRERALALGIDLVEWTYDPLLALNAHLNFAKLGVVVEEYEENIYGLSSSPLHGDLPTDRFIAQWWIRTRRVEDRLAGRGAAPTAEGAVPVNTVRLVGRWGACRDVDLASEADHLLVRVPTAFLGMLEGAPDLAHEWRLQTRAIFTTYFPRGYRAVEFLFDKTAGHGAYVLEREGRPGDREGRRTD